MDPTRMTADHFAAFEFHVEAFAALEAICGMADARMLQQWNRAYGDDYHDGYPKRDLHRSYSWWMYRSKQPIAELLDDWTLDWHLVRDSRVFFPDRRVGIPTFTAGASGEPGTIAKLPPDVADELSLAGF